MNKGVQIKFKRDFGDGLIKLIDQYLVLNYVEDDDKLIMACLAEIRRRVVIALEKVQVDYTMTLTPAQSIAIRIFYTDFITEPKGYTGNKLFQISNQVAEKYTS